MGLLPSRFLFLPNPCCGPYLTVLLVSRSLRIEYWTLKAMVDGTLSRFQGIITSLTARDWTVILISCWAAFKFLQALYNVSPLHPLRRVPGPKLAAATYLPEFYHDVILVGRYTHAIKKMHEKYGPIVRINPSETHCADMAFSDDIYAVGGRKRDKPTHQVNGSAIGTTNGFGTVDHDLHRARRGPVAKFFSRAMIARLEEEIHELVQMLCNKLLAESDASRGENKGRPLDIAHAYSCFTSDAISSYCFGEAFGLLSRDNWQPNYREATLAVLKPVFVLRFFPFLVSSVKLGKYLVDYLPADTALLIRTLQIDIPSRVQKTKTELDCGISHDRPTVFADLLQSELQESEKKTGRLVEEAVAVVNAGTETTSWALAVITYFLLSQPETLTKLQAELGPVVDDPCHLPSWTALEQLPYLGAVVQEGLRLSYGVSSRTARVPTTEDLVYQGDFNKRPVTLVLPRGYAIGMSAAISHHDEAIFPDSHAFIPERWLDEDNRFRKDLERSMIAFSKGSRGCLGKNLALCELYLSLTALVLRVMPYMRLYETTERDVRYDHDIFIPVTEKGSKGIRLHSLFTSLSADINTRTDEPSFNSQTMASDSLLTSSPADGQDKSTSSDSEPLAPVISARYRASWPELRPLPLENLPPANVPHVLKTYSSDICQQSKQVLIRNGLWDERETRIDFVIRQKEYQVRTAIPTIFIINPWSLTAPTTWKAAVREIAALVTNIVRRSNSGRPYFIVEMIAPELVSPVYCYPVLDQPGLMESWYLISSLVCQRLEAFEGTRRKMTNVSLLRYGLSEDRDANPITIYISVDYTSDETQWQDVMTSIKGALEQQGWPDLHVHMEHNEGWTKMSSLNARQTNDRAQDFIFTWLDDIETPSSDFPGSTHPPKRRKTNSSKQHLDHYHHRIPTPSSSCHASQGMAASSLPRLQNNSSSMPRKRTRSVPEGDEELVRSDQEGGDAIDDTPKASSRGWKKKAINLSQRSTASLASSSAASGASSPTKQIRYAATQEAGFTTVPFVDNVQRLPPSLKRIRQDLVDIGYGAALLPQSLQRELQALGDFPGFAFYDPSAPSSPWRIPPISLVRQLVTRAAECQRYNEGESSWNNDIHDGILKWVFRETNDVAIFDYRYCTGAQIIHEYRPIGTLSKSVDFCVCIKPSESSVEGQKSTKTIGRRPGISISHTEWGNLCKHPIALSIETKRQAEWEKALLQIATWHSAQWRALEFQATIKSIEFLAGVIVQGHSWYFVASTLQDGVSTLYHRIHLGSTENHFDLFKLLIALQCLGSWIKNEYWPAFRADVLGLPITEQEGP
ncbi:hypothetical protein F66182_8880 [Fusarium sp. NRRL 66182]|nr:hypothetical protein F66182_8880 [Fusarium sp. NRRL 66182]